MQRTASILLVATVGFAIFSASGAYAQVASQGVPAAVEPASSKVIDGVTFYYDADGNPLYKDDPVHYTPARRFYYRNGGWVMARSGSGHHHSRYANTGVHKRRGQGGQAGQTNQTGQGVSIRKSGTKNQAGRDGLVGQKGQRAGSSKSGQARQVAPSGRIGQVGSSASSGKSAGSGTSASGANSSSGGKSRSNGVVGSGKSGGGGGKASGGGASRSGGSAGHGGRRGPR